MRKFLCGVLAALGLATVAHAASPPDVYARPYNIDWSPLNLPNYGLLSWKDAGDKDLITKDGSNRISQWCGRSIGNGMGRAQCWTQTVGSALDPIWTSAGVTMTGTQGMVWPTDGDAYTNNRWMLLIAKLNAAGSTNSTNSLFAVNGTANAITSRQPQVYINKPDNTLRYSWIGSAGYADSYASLLTDNSWHVYLARKVAGIEYVAADCGTETASASPAYSGISTGTAGSVGTGGAVWTLGTLIFGSDVLTADLRDRTCAWGIKHANEAFSAGLTIPPSNPYATVNRITNAQLPVVLAGTPTQNSAFRTNGNDIAYGVKYGAANVGNGTVTTLTNGSVGGTLGEWVLTATDATHFGIVDPTGASRGTVTVGVQFNLIDLRLTVTAGATPFAAGDTIRVTPCNCAMNIVNQGVTQLDTTGFVTDYEQDFSNGASSVVSGLTYTPMVGTYGPMYRGTIPNSGTTWTDSYCVVGQDGNGTWRLDAQLTGTGVGGTVKGCQVSTANVQGDGFVSGNGATTKRLIQHKVMFVAGGTLQRRGSPWNYGLIKYTNQARPYQEADSVEIYNDSATQAHFTDFIHNTGYLTAAQGFVTSDRLRTDSAGHIETLTSVAPWSSYITSFYNPTDQSQPTACATYDAATPSAGCYIHVWSLLEDPQAGTVCRYLDNYLVTCTPYQKDWLDPIIPIFDHELTSDVVGDTSTHHLYLYGLKVRHLPVNSLAAGLQ